jgi:hypothetical protein
MVGNPVSLSNSWVVLPQCIRIAARCQRAPRFLNSLRMIARERRLSLLILSGRRMYPSHVP